MSLNEKSTEVEETSRQLEENKEDEKLVVVQFTDLDDANYCQHFSDQFSHIDIKSSNPIIKIGERLYSAEYANNLGTFLLFEDKEESTQQQSDNDKSTANFDYTGKTYKKLILTRLFVEEKTTTH